MVYVDSECANNIFYTNYPFVWPASLFLILAIFIPHIWVIDMNTPDINQDIERSISYTWTNWVSRGFIFISVLYNTIICAIGCYGAWDEHYTPGILTGVSWLIMLVALCNNSNFTDIKANYTIPTKFVYLKNEDGSETLIEEEELNKKNESIPLLDRPRYTTRIRNELREMYFNEKVIAYTHKTLAGISFSTIVVISIFLIIGEGEYNQVGNDRTLVITLFATGCVCLLAMILHLVIRSVTCVQFAARHGLNSYSWNGVVSYFERMFTMCFILLVIGTPKENI